MIRTALGKAPKGERLSRIKKSPNFHEGSFRNLSHTPSLNPGTSYIDILKSYFNIPKDVRPSQQLPTHEKTDLKNLYSANPTVIWFGHSSYMIHIDGMNILVDPVFSGNASPVSFIGKNFPGSNLYTVEDMPEIDILIITHDHYDHMDYKTITKLKPKIKNIVTSLGVGEHLEYWGYNSSIVSELDRREDTNISKIKITATPSRHFSGRNIKRNLSLRSSFVLKSEKYQIYIGGDSGYDTHFKKIGEKFGAFDLAILECGQYNEMRKYIHMMPEEVVQAAIDLNAKILLPVHRSKFNLALHSWNEPINRVTAEASRLNITCSTPMIGEKLIIGDKLPQNRRWIKTV